MQGTIRAVGCMAAAVVSGDDLDPEGNATQPTEYPTKKCVAIDSILIFIYAAGVHYISKCTLELLVQ